MAERDPDKARLGKIFISHSSTNKAFARRLERRLRKEGYDTWLDERQLKPGDSLAASISEALATSRVVLVVVSAASIKSRWLRFELNAAADRMVKGLCRVIPVVIESVPLPAEVQGLLYADFTKAFKHGIRAVKMALEHEVRELARLAGPPPFYRRVDAVVDRLLRGHAWVSSSGAYRKDDYETIEVPVATRNGENYNAVYETISGYGLGEPLDEEWWADFEIAQQARLVSDPLFLVVSERPVAFRTGRGHPQSPRVSQTLLGGPHGTFPVGRVVCVDLSGLPDDAFERQLRFAHEMLAEAAREYESRLEEFRSHSSPG